MPYKGLQAEGLDLLAAFGDVASASHSSRILMLRDSNKSSSASYQCKKDSWKWQVLAKSVTTITAFLLKSLTNNICKHTIDSQSVP